MNYNMREALDKMNNKKPLYQQIDYLMFEIEKDDNLSDREKSLLVRLERKREELFEKFPKVLNNEGELVSYSNEGYDKINSCYYDLIYPECWERVYAEAEENRNEFLQKFSLDNMNDNVIQRLITDFAWFKQDSDFEDTVYLGYLADSYSDVLDFEKKFKKALKERVQKQPIGDNLILAEKILKFIR